MSEIVWVSICLIIIFLVLVLERMRVDGEHREELKRVADTASESHRLLGKSLDARDDERAAWVTERQQLLDRIQAPSFAEFKQAEVKTIKLQQGIKDPPPLEPL